MVTDRYAGLRAALDHLENLDHTGVISSWVSQAPAVRALLADYDEAERALTLSGKVNKDLIDTALELTERIAKMEGALYAALPFVEDAEDDATYKPGVVRAARKQILAALAQEQGESDG